jgi:iron complex outermembrane receptor protein
MSASYTAATRALGACAAALAFSPATQAQSPATTLDDVVVTSVRTTEPLRVVTDPTRPRQPLPAHDGGDYLKAIPGFSLIRKGGTSGDPVFRGMAASRMNMSVDGEQLLGGCGMRMDPPTAYVFPETFDRVVVVKGPQTVLHGPGNSAAVVSFERSPADAEPPGLETRGSLLSGSFQRRDLVGGLRYGAERWHFRADGTYAESGDYADGDGNAVHSRYRRWTGDAALGYALDDRTWLEMSGARSDGEAAYADRAMDGSMFERSNVGLRFERRDVGRHVRRIAAQVYWNYVDHVMDNYSLRAFVPSAAMPGRTASNPDRTTEGGRVSADLAVGAAFTATVGTELQRNRHTIRGTTNETAMPFAAMPRVEDARFRNAGLYAEGTYRADPATKLVAGVRIDDWTSRDARARVAIGMGATAPNPTAGHAREATLVGGFARGERALGAAPVTTYVGVGYVERFPDYWELYASGRESTLSLSAFGTRPERTAQLDAGFLYESAVAAFSVSAYANRVDDYVLIQSN